ncbi:hypothetical protein Poly59_06900 [Rubripirellula reticaptiva]|uniref:Uncharacterized protein n=2 Tax=Rubripirellula reticaptiva TaxID=2528013 RepID=A0A5C6FDZ3_9BACT|nr:hypothetical protein Poly59_06900 [Rubripirellula reticaptiva]
MQTIEKNREQNLRRMFQNAEINFKGRVGEETAAALGDDALAIVESSTGQNLRPHENAKSKVEEMFESALGFAYSEVKGVFPLLEDVVSSLAPIYGIFSSVKDLFSSINQFRKTVMERYRAAKAVAEISRGDAQAAAQGVTRMINGLLVSSGVGMLRSTAQIAGGLMTLPLDGGMLAGGIGKVFQLIQKLVSLGLDFAERKAGRVCLQQKILDARIFQASPLMGCYLITCSNTSDLVGMLGTHTSQEHWRIKVERSKQKIDFLQKSARDFIANSRLEVTGLPMGMVVRAA